MQTLLTLERYSQGRLVETREQLSRSYTTDFIRALYAQQAQVGAASTILGMCAYPGLMRQGSGYGHCYGIVVGRGTAPPAVGDTQLQYPICHGRTFKPLQPALTNPSFETGDFTGWSTSNPGSVVEGRFTGSSGTYYWYTGTGSATRFISQSLDFTNVTAIGLRYSCASGVTLSLLYDTTTFYSDAGATKAVIVPVSTSGVKTLKVQVVSTGNAASIDTIEVYGTQLEISSTECLVPTFSHPDGELAVKRYFVNSSGGSVTINEVGIVTFTGHLIVRDVVSPGVAVNNGDTLRVIYLIKITA